MDEWSLKKKMHTDDFLEVYPHSNEEAEFTQ